MNESNANELFVWSKKLKLAVHESKELFLKRRFPQTWIVADSRHGLINFLLEEVETDVFFRFEIIEDRTFGNAGLACNRLRCGAVEAVCLQQIHGGGHATHED